MNLRGVAFRLSLLASLALMAGFAQIAPAAAAFKFCNKTSYVLAAALGYETQGKRYSEGWLVLQPGQCRTAIDAPLQTSDYYSFAYTLPIHEGSVKYFAGAVPFCASDGIEAFKIVGQEDCERRGFSRRSFAHVDTGGARDWTTSFTETADYTLETARVAGAQRLFGDIGVKRMRVDGYLGADTQNQIIKFKKANGLSADTTMPDSFFDRLIEKAQEVERETGFSFCNEMDDVAWGAIAYREEGEDVSTGWFKIAPRTCLKAIKDRLREEEYFAYATLDPSAAHPLVWGGEYLFCTMENRFTIKGKTQCDARGYVATGFARLAPGAQGGAVKRLTAEDARPRP